MHAPTPPHDLLDEAEDTIYRTCLQNGPLTREELSAHLDRPRTECGERLDGLIRIGLVQDRNGVIDALPPRAALNGLATQFEAAAENTRQRANGWTDLWEQYRERPSYFEVIEDGDTASALDDLVVRGAREQLRGMQIGPVGPATMQDQPKVADGFFDAVGRGVRFRVVYGVGLLHDPLALPSVQRCITAGEEARVFPDVPLNLTIGDSRVGVITVPQDVRNRRNAILVHPSGLLNAMIALFESYWRMAVPISAEAEPAADEEPPEKDARQLLAYLSAGLTDESIAREIGVSERTVGRRVARLQELLGAHSRFQLGSQAVRRGWI